MTTVRGRDAEAGRWAVGARGGLWLLLGRRRRDAEQQRRCENKQIVRFVLNVINDMIDDYVVRFTFEFFFLSTQ